ncbi:hypothetical protein TNCV_3944741 [Trichonephila clavipes]|nr:hypothetical protein TNCV_3944741 [Trichonephila clavipes]
MANYSGCPKFPKHRKGTQEKTNTYTNTVNSIVRPGTSYSQAASTSNSTNSQQMAPHVKETPAASSVGLLYVNYEDHCWKLQAIKNRDRKIFSFIHIFENNKEFYPSCIEDTDKSTPEKIVLRINLENEEKAENFKNRYSVVSNTNSIVYGCTPNPQRFVFSKTWICHNSKRHKRNARRNADCKAKLSIVIKKITKGTKKKDKYLKYDIPLAQLLKFMRIIFGQFFL